MGHLQIRFAVQRAIQRIIQQTWFIHTWAKQQASLNDSVMFLISILFLKSIRTEYIWSPWKSLMKLASKSKVKYRKKTYKNGIYSYGWGLSASTEERFAVFFQ